MAENSPKILPKWPFLAGDIILIILACFIVIASPKPMAALSIFACALSVILGMLIFVTPYLIEHLTAQQTIKLKQAKAEETLLKAVDLASDLLNRTETMHAELMKSVLVTKQVPAKLEEKTEELVEALDSDRMTQAVVELNDALARIESLPATSTSEEVSANSQSKLVIDRLNALNSEVVAIGEQFEEVIEYNLNAMRVELRKTLLDSRPEPSSLTEEDELEEEDATEQLEEPTFDEAKPTEEPDFEQEKMKNGLEETNQLVLEEAEVSEPQVSESQNHAIEIAISENRDGTTRLVVGAFIGISNKLFIRGDGPGLDWNKGVPMELVGIGKWEWKTSDASETVNCKVLINDEQWTDSDNIAIEPGTTVETTASF